MTTSPKSPAAETPAPTHVERCRPRKECWALYNACEDDWAKHDFRMASCSGCWVRGPVGPTLPLVPTEPERPLTDLSTVEGRGQPGDPRFSTIAHRIALRVLEPSPYMLLSYLMFHGESDGGNSFPSKSEIGRELGWSASRVDRWMQELDDAWWIERIAFVDRHGRAVSNLYRFRIPRRLPGHPSHRGMEGAIHWSNRLTGYEPKARW